MIDITDASPLSPTNNVALPRKWDISRLWSRVALAAVLLLSIFMNFFQLGQDGYGNLYYAAAVKVWGTVGRISSLPHLIRVALLQLTNLRLVSGRRP